MGDLIHRFPFDLQVGDEIRFNRARKKDVIVSKFERKGKTHYVLAKPTDWGGENFETRESEYLHSVHVYYGNVFDGIVEVNGKKVRGTGGKLLNEPKVVEAKPNVAKPKKPEMPFDDVPSKDVTKNDFIRFLMVQRSGVINMTDIVRGSIIAHLPESKYEDIMWHYTEYKTKFGL